MQKQTNLEPLWASMAKLVLVVAVIASLGAMLGTLGYALTKPKPAFTPIPKAISAIELSSDAKSILNAETGEVIFTIDDANKYLKYSGYAYDPDTFQDTNAKYVGDCFLDVALKVSWYDRIVFSTGCLPGDLPQAWIGVYKYYNDYCPPNAKCEFIPKENRIKFLIGGGGRDFVWSQDDKTITYEADLGLSGMTEIRTIDSQTGEIIKSKNNDETADWKTYRNEDLGFKLKYPSDVIVNREYNDKYNRLVIFTNKKYSFEVRIRDGKAISLDEYHFLYFPVSSKSVLGGKEALIFEAPHGYCDGPGYGKPFIAYSAKNGDDFYNLVLYGDMNLSDKEKNILSTFKFIEKNESE